MRTDQHRMSNCFKLKVTFPKEKRKWHTTMIYFCQMKSRFVRRLKCEKPILSTWTDTSKCVAHPKFNSIFSNCAWLAFFYFGLSFKSSFFLTFFAIAISILNVILENECKRWKYTLFNNAHEISIEMRIKLMIYKCHMTHLEAIENTVHYHVYTLHAHKMLKSWRFFDLSQNYSNCEFEKMTTEHRASPEYRWMCTWANRVCSANSVELHIWWTVKDVILAMVAVHVPCHVSAMFF